MYYVVLNHYDPITKEKDSKKIPFESLNEAVKYFNNLPSEKLQYGYVCDDEAMETCEVLAKSFESKAEEQINNSFAANMLFNFSNL